MTARTVIVALLGTIFLVFFFPYILAILAPLAVRSGLETLLLVALLWSACWAVGRFRSKRGTTQR